MRKIPAFTLIELMIVMMVIAVLAGITIPVSKYVTYRARQASQKVYIEKIKSALEDYRAAYGEYPITPSTNTDAAGRPDNYDDALRHYGNADYHTRCYYTTNSPFTTVNLTTTTVETITTEGGTRRVDYSLTYPLMIKQLESGARPFMDFKEITVAYLIYKPQEELGVDVYEVARKRKTAGGNIITKYVRGIYGNAVNRYNAIDPVSQKQWKFVSDGVTYSLTTNSF